MLRTTPYPLAVALVLAACGDGRPAVRAGAQDSSAADSAARALAIPGQGGGRTVEINGRRVSLDSVASAVRDADFVAERASPTDTLEGGAIVTIVPARGSHRLTEEELAGGRVVARLVNAAPKANPRLAIPASGETLWFVYREEGGRWKSIFVPRTPAMAPRVRNMELLRNEQHDEERSRWYKQSELGSGAARSAVAESEPWNTCTRLGCCRPQG